MVRGVSRIIAVTALMFSVASCGTSAGGAPRASLSDRAVKAGWISVDPIKVVLPTADRVQGPTKSLDTSGEVIVNVWASYCGPCVAEMPVLEQVVQTGRVEVVGMTRDIRTSYAKNSIRDAGVTYPIYKDPGATLAIRLDGRIPLNAIPSTILLRQGEVVAVHIGELRTTGDVLSVLDEKRQ
jgi:thiol-disulfide isomerase/thioredoxin